MVYIYRKSAEKYEKNELSYSYPMVTLWLSYGKGIARLR